MIHVNYSTVRCGFEPNRTKLQKWTAFDDVGFDKTVFVCMFSKDKCDWLTASRESVNLIFTRLQQKWTPAFFRKFAVHSMQKDARAVMC